MKIRMWLWICVLFLGGVCEVKGNPVDALASRVTDGTSTGRFTFLITPSTADSMDYFEISSEGKKVKICGNSYLSVTTGFNWYLKYVAHIHLAWNNPVQRLPATLPFLKETIRKETSMKCRYYLNYCTFGYTMAFWDWHRWEQELDWMALHGINMALDVVGVETVWRNLLKRNGYSREEVNEFVAGPAYLPWWEMNNLEGWGGPNPDSWYEQQEVLQKKIVSRMKELGIEPVFPGYAGMVPRNIGEKLGYSIADPGKWCGFNRPAFLSPEDTHFTSFASMYYEELEKLYGRARYYSIDPFHEGETTGGVDLAKAGAILMEAMKKANPKAVWVIQAWQANPREAMIDGLKEDDLLVLDLYSEKRPQWGDPDSQWYRAKGFGKHNWLYCMLLNFGGRVGLHGRMEQLVNGYYKAYSQDAGKTLRGVGTTPEGIENNPVMFELLYELPWRNELFSTTDWLYGYLKARYGEASPAVIEAWMALMHTVYNAPKDYPGEGPVESLLCARPGFHLKSSSTWGCSDLYYSADSTAKAARLLVSVANRYRGVNNFEYDVVDVLRQSIADRANGLLKKISESYDRKDIASYQKLTLQFLNLILIQDKLLSTRKEFSVYPWIAQARSLGNTAEEKDLYEWNASALITVWGDSIASEWGGLHDYSHREWHGILTGLYYRRWERFFKQQLKVLQGKATDSAIDFYGMNKAWAENEKMRYQTPTTSTLGTVREVYFSVFGRR